MDNIDELKIKVDKLEKEIEDLKEKIKLNFQKDKKHHQELKEIQKEQHKENMIWNKITGIGVIAIPLLLKLAEQYFFKSKKDKENKEN